MADLTRIQADLPTMLVGSTSTGSPTTPVASDTDGNMFAVDTIQSAISSGAITVGTTATAARVGASNLTNRKMLMICPVTYIIYMGADASVTPSTGVPIYPGRVVSFGFSANVTPYLVSANSGSVIIFEGA